MSEVAQENFLDRAYPRMLRISTVLAVAGAVATLALCDRAAALGFVLGSAAGILNFIWLHRAVDALINRMLRGDAGGSRFRMTIGFLGRYGVVALVAYAIFKSSAHAFGGFLAALPLPVLAAMCEAAYEAVLNTKDPNSANT
jgi:hypothetical protein